ncbi:MAG: hypothetical protein JNN28_21520, partial [Saprospiraceae bacterium]|nr:hypothetical protein [Saprospiraceae bacterium]
MEEEKKRRPRLSKPDADFPLEERKKSEQNDDPFAEPLDKPTERPDRGSYERKPWQDRNQGGERKPWQDRNQGGGGGYERKPWQDRNQGGERKPWQDRNQGGEQRPWQDRNQGGEQRPWQDRNQGGGNYERRPYQDRNQGGGGYERKPWQDRNQGGQGGGGYERRPYQDRNQGGERRPWQDRGQGGEQRPWQDRGQGGEQRPWQDRGQGGGGGYERRPYQQRGGGGGGYGRKPFGQKNFRNKNNDIFIENKPKPDLPTGEGMPLNKYLAHCGLSSRRKAVEFIESGKVTVNGEVKLEPFYRVQTGDVVMCDGQPMKVQERMVYVLLNKPKNVITTTDDDRGRPTVLDIVDPNFPERLFPV